MLEYVIMVGGAILSLVVMISKKKERRAPLKNADKVAVELNSETSLEAFHIYLPTANFITNMCAAVENERSDLRALWSDNKAKFHLIWRGFTDQQQKALMSTLIEELKFSIENYSDTDKLLSLLCPNITEKYLLSDVEAHDIIACEVTKNKKRAGDESAATAAAPAASVAGVQELVMRAQDKVDIKHFCPPLLVLAAERVEKELDPNGNVKIDQALMQHVEVFLRALQQLCAIKFAKQVLTRYKAEPRKSFWVRTAKNVAPVCLFGVLAMLTAYLMDRYGFLDMFLWNYKSPFK